ncbi:type 4a pilus biogenesis protein PilO [Hydrogenophilus islandicus]
MKERLIEWALQFRNLDPNDPGRWPLLPQATVLAVVFLLALFLAWYLLWSDQVAAIEAAVAKEPQLKEQWLAKKRQAVNLPLLRAQVTEAEKQFGALLKRLPSKAEVDGLLQEAHRYGLQRGLQFELFRPGGEVTKEFYAELPVTIRLTGSYHAIAGFLSDVSSMPRVVSFADFKLAPATGGEPGAPLLRLDATLFAYRYLEAEERAAAAPQGQSAQGRRR